MTFGAAFALDKANKQRKEKGLEPIKRIFKKMKQQQVKNFKLLYLVLVQIY